MSVRVAPPSVARGVGAKHTQRYEALKRELEEFCAKGPQHDAATPLHHAAEEGDVPLIRALLKIGAQVDERDAEGQTPLMVAASWGQPDSIRALVEGGADTSAQDDGGDTALHEAARADEVEALMTLLDLGAEKDPRNKLGATPLHLASHKGNNAATKALIRGGAAVSGAKSLMRGGYSPLHAAAANGSADCLQDLIDAGSSLRHSASESSLRGGSATALELAEDAGQERTASMLRNASVSEFEKYGMWGKPGGDDAGGTSGG